MLIKSLGSKLVVKPDKLIEKVVNGIVIPEIVESLTEKNICGTVIGVGPGIRNDKGIRIPLDIEPGDRVFLAKYAGSRLYVDKEEILIIDISEVLAVEEYPYMTGCDPTPEQLEEMTYEGGIK